MPSDGDDEPQTTATEEEVAKESSSGKEGAADLKIILLGDSAVGKSKLVERYLMGDYHPRQLSTFALTLYRKEYEVEEDNKVQIDFWDTAGQERFNSMHPSYYFQAHCCILVFDVTRKATYKHLQDWYDELRSFRETIPVICVANKIDANYSVTKKKFKFAIEKKMPFFFVSAADGTNVVQMFEHAIKAAHEHKQDPGADLMTDIMNLLGEEKEGEGGQKTSTEEKSSGK